MSAEPLDNSSVGNFDTGEFITQKLDSVRSWIQKIITERRNIELKTNRKRKMINQLEVETIANLPIELKSSLRVPR